MLTIDTITAGYQNENWGGFGYLGGRRNALTSTDPECPAQPDVVAAVDQIILDTVNAQGWTADELFDWTNSTLGRWFADAMLGQTVANVPADFARWGAGLLVKVDA